MMMYQIALGVLYFPSFLDDPDAALVEAQEQIQFTQRSRHMYGRKVLTPRLEAWHGDTPYRFGGSELPARPLTPLIQAIAVRAETYLSEVGLHDVCFNTCLANLYRDGRDSVGWHSDDEPEMGDPVIASVSLGAERDFLLRRKGESRAVKVPLKHGSMLAMLRGVQADWEHSVPKRVSSGTRLNLTFRDCRVQSQP